MKKLTEITSDLLLKSKSSGNKNKNNNENDHELQQGHLLFGKSNEKILLFNLCKNFCL